MQQSHWQVWFSCGLQTAKQVCDDTATLVLTLSLRFQTQRPTNIICCIDFGYAFLGIKEESLKKRF